jgi:hypothetical protein
MNERLQELIIEANNYAIEKCPIPDDADSMTKELIIGNRLGESQRKLAELIVAECADVFTRDLPDPTSPDYKLGTLNEVVNRACNVAEHFGYIK